MKIGLITYDIPHLKTEQVFYRIKDKDHEYTFFLLPFKPYEYRERLLVHRPHQSSAVHPEKLAREYGPRCMYCGSSDGIQGCDMYLILGGQIIKNVGDRKILNCHPGVIPLVRGLDAFKWAIYDGQPVGVTLHYIDDEVDVGDIVNIELTDVFEEDTIYSFARRHYEHEITMMSNFDNLECHVTPIEGFGRAHMRMGMGKEAELLFPKFDEYVEKFAK